MSTRVQSALDRCDFKQKFNTLWQRAFSAIRFINGKGVEDGNGSVTLVPSDIGAQAQLTAGENITIEDNVISATGGGSAPVWGNITGTLTDQSDLKDALDGKASIYDTYTKDETDVLLSYKADVASVEAIEDEIGAVGQAGTIRNDIALVNDRVDSVEDEIGPETTAGTLRYKIKENANDIISIENEIDIIDGIIASHSTAINGKADKTYVDAHIADTSNPHMVNKAQVGLSNVDNTSDLNKPISTATQTALNAKQSQISYASNSTNINIPAGQYNPVSQQVNFTGRSYALVLASSREGSISGANNIILGLSLDNGPIAWLDYSHYPGADYVRQSVHYIYTIPSAGTHTFKFMMYATSVVNNAQNDIQILIIPY